MTPTLPAVASLWYLLELRPLRTSQLCPLAHSVYHNRGPQEPMGERYHLSIPPSPLRAYTRSYALNSKSTRSALVVLLADILHSDFGLFSILIRQAGSTPPAFFRFLPSGDTLARGYVLGRECSYPAHRQEGPFPYGEGLPKRELRYLPIALTRKASSLASAESMGSPAQTAPTRSFCR